MRHDLFPTPLWHIEGGPQELIDELYQGAYRFKKQHPSNQLTNFGGYQSPGFGWKDFHPQGIEYIQHVIKETFTEIESAYGHLKPINWWYNINSQGNWNVPHTHPNSDFALVLYLTDSDGLLCLTNPHSQRGIDKQNTAANAQKGDIVIFPSDIWHYVMPNPREEDRISISMNLRLL